MVLLGVLMVEAEESAPVGKGNWARAEHSPYGVCAHLGGGEEFDQMPHNLQVMREAGIGWARADFPWGSVATKAGGWRFVHLDRVLAQTEETGLRVLPILDYDVPWATPAYRHLDAWEEYVTRVVSRYRDRVKYWEVWNEQNLEHFWREKADPKNYQLLLERTYAAIKRIDPQLQVVYGGLAGIPWDFLEGSLQAGAARSFDVFNIHPYRAGMTTMAQLEQYYAELVRLRQTLDEHGAKGKPIWVTEMGWATPPGVSAVPQGILAAAKRILSPEAKEWPLAVLVDERLPQRRRWSREGAEKILPEGGRVVSVRLEELEKLSPQKTPALLLPPGEFCLTPYLADLQRYVRDGGVLILLGGVPFYYDTAWQDGRLQQTGHAPERWRESFRIGWQAWWNAKDVPEQAAVRVAAEGKNAFAGLKVQGQAGRFLTAEKLRPGDTFTSLLEARRGDFTGVVAAIYRFGDGGKGAVVVSTLMEETVQVTEAEQAAYLPQAILLSLQGGVERFFWYEFQSPERDDLDKEHHFGLVHRDLSPKPAYVAYRTLTRMRPAGSESLTGGGAWKNPAGYCHFRWRTPDGKTMNAAWSPEKEVVLSLKGKLKDAWSFLGEPLSVREGNLPLESTVVYWEEE